MNERKSKSANDAYQFITRGIHLGDKDTEEAIKEARRNFTDRAIETALGWLQPRASGTTTKVSGGTSDSEEEG